MRNPLPGDPSGVLHFSDAGLLWFWGCALQSAETEHASVRLLAGSLLTMGSQRNSAALSRGFRSVADAAVKRDCFRPGPAVGRPR
jgi:hypothetical protein